MEKVVEQIGKGHATGNELLQIRLVSIKHLARILWNSVASFEFQIVSTFFLRLALISKVIYKTFKN